MTRLAHPVSLAAIAVMIANDHVWKASHPGWLTGKLSDVAGMIFFPLLLAALVGVRSHRGVVIAAIATAIVFALVKTCPPATELYRWTLGVLQWPFGLVHGVHRPIPVEAVTDPTDLVAIPFVAVAIWISACRPASAR